MGRVVDKEKGVLVVFICFIECNVVPLGVVEDKFPNAISERVGQL